MQNKLLLSVGAVLVVVGVFKPDLGSIRLPVIMNLFVVLKVMLQMLQQIQNY